jgi:DNA ligase 1
MSAFSIRFDGGGVHLPELGLWLDPHAPKSGEERVFVSHAHADHIGAHREVILSAPTSRLMRARLPGERVEHVLPFGQAASFERGGLPFTITLLPAGHVLGSAMALIQVRGTSLLYTGDFALRPSASAELCDPRPADILIMETTFGLPRYRFPAASEILDGVVRFCRETLDNDEVPVLLAYSLGKSQEVLCGLKASGFSFMLHPQVHKLTAIYREFGVEFPPFEKLDPSTAAGRVVICPPAAFGSDVIKAIGPIRSAALTGWAVDPGCRFRYRTDAAFPLSDHADFPGLIDFVRQVSPKEVYTLHGFATEFAETLREMGYGTHALGREEQLTLGLAGAQAERYPSMPDPEARANRLAERPVRAEPSETPVSETGGLFRVFAELCSEIGATPKKLEKTQLLADYVRTVEPSLLAPVSSWLTGHPFPPSQNKPLRLGWAVIRDAVCLATGLGQSEFGEAYLKHSDLGETASEILQASPASSQPLSLGAVDTVLQQLFAARGSLGKTPILAGALGRCDSLEAKYLVKILTGELRIGLKEGLVEEAIAQAFAAPIDEVKTANLIVGNIGETALLARRGELKTATVSAFRPVRFMLASAEQTAEAVWTRASSWDRADAEPGEATVPKLWVEDKYDGIRCQLHKVGTRVSLYSRDLKEITATFLELVDATRLIEGDFVVDGEILAMRGGRALPFVDLQRRLGRKEADLFLSEEIPVRFVAFDLLWVSGESLLDHPFRERRARLEQLQSFHLATVNPAGSVDEIESAFSAAKERGNEGIVIKDPRGTYSPGRRGLSWLKLKKAFGTLDCVVVGAEYGHGRRKHVLSDYTFAVREEVSGDLRTIGKSGTGLTDAEIAELTRQFLETVVARKGRYLELTPGVVLEVAFDSVQLSERHSSGLALRFPRIVRIRKDKSPDEIDTLENARRMVKTDARRKRSTAVRT